MVLSEGSLQVLAASENLQEFLGIQATDALGTKLNEWLDQQTSAFLLSASSSAKPELLNPFPFKTKSSTCRQNLIGIIHRTDEGLVVDVEHSSFGSSHHPPMGMVACHQLVRRRRRRRRNEITEEERGGGRRD